MYKRIAVHSNAAAQASASAAFAAGLTLSVGLHFAVFTWNPAFRTNDVSFASTELTAVDMPPEIRIPPPPEAIARPAVPVVASHDIDESITIAPTTFEANPLSTLPPPPVAARQEQDLKAAPQFTPFTVRPELRNPDAVRTQMLRVYPPMLRDAGIGGTVILWVFIDQTGTVQRAVVHTSSGQPRLDDAAVEIAPVMSFTPAIFRDSRVPVWIEMPLVFTVR